MATIGELLINMKADTTALRSDLQKARDSVAGAVDVMVKRLKELGEGAGLFYLGEKLKGMVEGVINYGAQMKNLAEKSGMSTEAISGLAFAAKQSGVDVESLAIGIKKLNVNMLDAATGVGANARYFNAMGVEVKDANGQLRPTEAVLLDLAAAFQRLGPGVESSGLSVKLFGKAGDGMLPFLLRGVEGIKEFIAQAQAAGKVVGAEFAAGAHEMEQSLNLMKARLEGVAITTVGFYLPAMKSVVDFWTTWGADKGFGTNVQENPALGLLATDAERAAVSVKKAADATDAANAKLKAMNVLQKAAKEDYLTKTLASLREQVAVMGMNAAELMRYDLVQKGANQTQLAAAEAWRRKIAAWREEQDLLSRITPAPQFLDLSSVRAGIEQVNASLAAQTEALKKEVSGLQDAAVPAIDKYNAAQERLDLLLRIGAINWQQYGVAVRAVADQAGGPQTDAQVRGLLAWNDALNADIQAIKDQAVPATERLAEAHAKLNAFLAEGAITQREYDVALKKLAPEMLNLGKLAQQFEIKTVDAFATAIVQGKGFGQVVTQLIQEMATLLLKMALFKSLGAFIPGFGTLSGGSGLAGALGFLAGGGNYTAGQPIVVGENGPELLVPGASGSVISNRELSRRGGAAVHQYFDFRQADASIIPYVEQRLAEVGQQSVARAVGTVVQMSRRTS